MELSIHTIQTTLQPSHIPTWETEIPLAIIRPNIGSFHDGTHTRMRTHTHPLTADYSETPRSVQIRDQLDRDDCSTTRIFVQSLAGGSLCLGTACFCKEKQHVLADNMVTKQNSIFERQSLSCLKAIFQSYVLLVKLIVTRKGNNFS